MTSFSSSTIKSLSNSFNSVGKYWTKKTLSAKKAWDVVDVVYDEAQIIYSNKQHLVNNSEDLISLKEAIDTVSGMVDSNSNYFTFTGLQSLRGLNGINRAFNSKKYPDVSSLKGKASSVSQSLVENGKQIGLRA
ncbi:MAG: hypothetical protein SWX82_34550, partial [Cyanobacteriota bacterium]|nr:hypothetical protein [Cyanobacteriota bacterium]